MTSGGECGHAPNGDNAGFVAGDGDARKRPRFRKIGLFGPDLDGGCDLDSKSKEEKTSSLPCRVHKASAATSVARLGIDDWPQLSLQTRYISSLSVGTDLEARATGFKLFEC